MMISDKEILPPNRALKMQIVNFIVDKFPTQQSLKEFSRENKRRVTEEKMRTRLGGEFWALDVIMHHKGLLWLAHELKTGTLDV